METTIKQLKQIVNTFGEEVTFDEEVVLNTCIESQPENLSIKQLVGDKTNQNAHLWAVSNWGTLDIEEYIKDEDDWGILLDVVTDILDVYAPLSDEEILEHKGDLNDNNPMVYCGTYHKYNCGSLKGMWIDLTTFYDFEEFIEFCNRLHFEERDAELMFQDYQGFPEQWYTESCMDEETFDKIIEYSNLSDNDKEGFELYLDNVSQDADIDEFKNNSHGDGWIDEEEYAEHYAMQCMDIPDHLEKYIDYTKIADELFMYGEFEFCDGWVFSKYV